MDIVSLVRPVASEKDVNMEKIRLSKKYLPLNIENTMYIEAQQRNMTMNGILRVIKSNLSYAKDKLNSDKPLAYGILAKSLKIVRDVQEHRIKQIDRIAKNPNSSKAKEVKALHNERVKAINRMLECLSDTALGDIEEELANVRQVMISMFNNEPHPPFSSY